jgi:hypothetical protein
MSMKALIISTKVIFLCACGGGVGVPSTESEPIDSKDLVSYETSSDLFVRNSGDAVVKNDLNAWNFNARYLGRDFVKHGNSAKSGTLSAVWHERGFTSDITVNPSDWQEVVGGGPHTVFSIDTNAQLVPMTVTYDAEIFKFSGNGVGQLSFAMYWQHKTTGKLEGFVFAMYDNRFDSYETFVGNDLHTDFYSTPVHTVSSNKMQMNLFAKTAYKLELTDAVLKSIKPDYKDYAVVLAGFLHEVFIDRYGHVNMAVKVENLKIQRL